MQSDEAIVSILRWTRENKQYVFTVREFARLFCTPYELKDAPATIDRLAEIEFIDNITDSVIVVNDRADANAQEHIALKLRPHDLVMATGPSAAAAHDLISQIPAALTCLTTGEAGDYHTRFGAITFEHTDLPEDVLLKDATTFSGASELEMTSKELTYALLSDAYRKLADEHVHSNR